MTARTMSPDEWRRDAMRSLLGLIGSFIGYVLSNVVGLEGWRRFGVTLSAALPFFVVGLWLENRRVLSGTVLKRCVVAAAGTLALMVLVTMFVTG